LLLKEWCEVKQRYWGLVGMLGLGLSLTLAGCGGGGGGGGSSAVGSDSRYDTSNVTVSTVAGTGAEGYEDGIATTMATFKSPTGLALGTMNTYRYIFVADTGNSMIRMINLSNDNSVTTLIGKQTYTGSDGTSVTKVCSKGLICDSSGNLYMTDVENSRILKVNCDSGTDVTKEADSSSDLNGPVGIVLDGSTFYVVNNTDNRVLRINSGGYGILAGTTEGYDLFGSSPVGTAARFDSPYGIASDGTNLYVTDSDNNTIRKLVISGTTATVTTLAGNPSASGDWKDGTGEGALFKTPKGITYNEDDQCLYVADTGNHVIRKIDSNGVVTTIAGYIGYANYNSGTVTTGNAAKFSSPTGIVYDGDGNLYIADSRNNRIRKIELQ
jgi:sugar lactone lactonase YvrE